MKRPISFIRSITPPRRHLLFFSGMLISSVASHLSAADRVYNVREFGASGKKSDDARPAIQRAIDVCAMNQGGTVLLPAGDYTSGTLRLRSHVRIEVAAGATLFASQDPNAFPYEKIAAKAALLFGEDLEDVEITGQGVIDGQAEYEWRDDNFERGFRHKETMKQLGKPLRRSFPKGFPQRQVFPRLLWLGQSKNIRFRGLRWLHSPSWNFTLYACEHVTFDGIYAYSSLHEAVWADGIDLDGCRDVRIENCTLETGDDCVVFISSTSWGPALPCERVLVNNCRLSSASAGVKFSEGNWAGIHHIQVTNCVFTNVNRGFVFSTTQGGDISAVELTDLTIDCQRFDWFWSGDAQPFFFRITRLSEFNNEDPKPGERPPGTIRQIAIKNVNARAKGTSRFTGHAESWLQGISLENVKIAITSDPNAPFDYADHAMEFARVRDLTIRGLEISWVPPYLAAWQSALALREIQNCRIEQVVASNPPKQTTPAVLFDRVVGGSFRHSRALPGTDTFLQVSGESCRNLQILSNDFSMARSPYRISPGAGEASILLRDNRTSAQR